MNMTKIFSSWTAYSAFCRNIKQFYCPSHTRTLRTSYPLSNNERIIKFSPEYEITKQLIEMEMRTEKELGNNFIPDTVSDKHWIRLLEMKSPRERKSFYKYLKKTELKEKKQKEKRLQMVLQRQTEIEQKRRENPNHIQYGLGDGNNSLFFKIKPSALQVPYYNNLRDAVLFGQKIVIDLGYESWMYFREMQSCVDQIKWCHVSNKRNKEPFYLHLCNAKLDGEMVAKLKSLMPFLKKPHPLVNLTEKSYLDLFPNNKLVYLTPHCDEDLETYSHDDIYIIGGLVDQHEQGPISLARAKKENLRMARLPLEKYLRWGSGNKCLSLNQVMNILLTLKDTMDWNEAMRHVPTRKLQHPIIKKKNNL